MKNTNLVAKILLAAVTALVGVTVASQKAQAADFSFVPRKGAELTLLNEQLKNQMFSDALIEWDSKISGTALGKSNTGSALYAYLLARNGLVLRAVERLQNIPMQNVDERLRLALLEVLPISHWAWVNADIKSTSKSKGLFEPEALDWVRKLSKRGVANAGEANLVMKALKRITLDNERAIPAYHLALWASLNNKNALAESYLLELESSDQTAVPKDRVLLALARLFYQNRRFIEAADTYRKIPQGSDYWIEALEESAYAKLQNKEPQRSLALLRTVNAPLFTPVVGPEPHYLAAFIYMKLCDYGEVFKSLQTFKKVFKDRARLMNGLATQGVSAEAKKAISTFTSQQYDWQSIGPDMKLLPRLFYRDQDFLNPLQSWKTRSDEVTISTNLIAKASQKNLIVGNLLADQKAAQAKFRSVQNGQDLAYSRLKSMAKVEVAEIARILQRFQVIEADTIQRLYDYQQAQPNIKGKYKDEIVRTRDTMVFKANDEVWLDELDKYHVEVKGCPTRKEVSK